MKLSAAVIIPILSLLSRAHADVPVHSHDSCHGCWKTVGIDGKWVYVGNIHSVDGKMPALQCLYTSRYTSDKKIGFSCEYDRVRTGSPLNS